MSFVAPSNAPPTSNPAEIRPNTDEAFKRAVAAWGLPDDRAAITVKEFCDWARISRSTFYNLVASGQLATRKIGNRTLVLCVDAQKWLEALPRSDEFIAAVRKEADQTQDRAAVDQSQNRYLSAAEVAKRFDCSIRTVRRWLADGVLKSVCVGGLVRISEAAIASMLEQQR
jgi:excisionase family DNA binding protein